MNELKIFENAEFGSVRTIQENEKILFCGSDIVKALGYTNPQKALNDHCREDGVTFRSVIDKMGRTQEAKFIDEGNLYRLIVHSKLPSAQKFERWVFDEVLPSIRKHGMYAKEELLDNPDLLISVAQELKAEKERNKVLEEDNKRMRPKEIFADAVAVSNDAILIGELSKIIKQNGYEIGQNRLFDWMRKNNYLISRQGQDYNMPTQKSMELGLFRIKERTINNPDGSTKITKTVLVTGKGQSYFINKFLGWES